MDKIVIITNQPEPDRGLLVLLNLGFREVGTFEKRPAGGRPTIYSECVHTGDHD